MEISAGPLVASFVVSTIGFGYFLYGKREGHIPALGAGVAMMVYPYFVSSVALSLGLSILCIGGVWAAARAGA